LTRRLERLGLDPLGFVANDYAISVWGLKDMARVDMDHLFDQDMLGDDLGSGPIKCLPLTPVSDSRLGVGGSCGA
jgi:hypothetical protein